MSSTMVAGAIQLDAFRWMLPREGGMRVPGILFADRPLLERMMSDRTPDQVRNAAHLPGILEASIAMPDAHWGYGLPVGGVVATDVDGGVVSPGAVGYDIGCGVRLLASRLARAALAGRADALADALYRAVPCGVGASGTGRLASGADSAIGCAPTMCATSCASSAGGASRFRTASSRARRWARPRPRPTSARCGRARTSRGRTASASPTRCGAPSRPWRRTRGS